MNLSVSEKCIITYTIQDITCIKPKTIKKRNLESNFLSMKKNSIYLIFKNIFEQFNKKNQLCPVLGRPLGKTGKNMAYITAAVPISCRTKFKSNPWSHLDALYLN